MELQGLELHLYRGLSGVYRRVRSRAHVLVVVHAHARLPAQPVAALVLRRHERRRGRVFHFARGGGPLLVLHPLARMCQILPLPI